MGEARPTFWLLAGPNGVGKTTWAFRHLRDVSGSVRFVNLDEIARGLSPLAPEIETRRAARVALELARDLISRRITFALETTLAGHAQLGLAQRAAATGFATSLLYFSVRDPAILLERIARRVVEGGHDVPEALVRRRFARGLANLAGYAAACDVWRIFEASGPKPRLGLEGRGTETVFRDEAVLAQGHPALAAFGDARPRC